MRRNNRGIFYNMDKYCVYVLLCLALRLSVNGQMLVSHNEGVIVMSSSQHKPDGDIWNINHVVDNITAINAEECKCCGATNDDMNPWFELDLREEYNIQRIHVIGRQDSDQYLYKMEIQLGTTDKVGTVLQGEDTSDMNLRELDYTLPSPEPARFITFILRDFKQFFLICELYVYAVCNEGTYGPNCVHTCGKCNNNETCDDITGECSVCINGHQTPLCQECIDGRYGSSCIAECGHCNNSDTCDKRNGFCPSGCSAGYEGNTCTQDCSFGTYGLGCLSTCGECKSSTSCNNVDGTCTACVVGYLDPLCKDCKDGRYGSTCNEKCGHCKNDDVCDKSNGYCPNGCSAGYQVTNCQIECGDGTYGLDCQKTCGNCLNNGPCNKIHGDCVTCAAGFKGNSCIDECQTGTFGFNCIHQCGMCLEGDMCDIYSGECPRGCTDGYKGGQCSQKLNEVTSPCSPYSDNTCISIPVFIGSLFAVIAINTSSACIWMRYRNSLHKKTHKAANNANSSIELPNTPSNYDTLEFDNLDEESKYTELNRRP